MIPNSPDTLRETTPTSATAIPRLHLDFLDGVRAVTALYVMHTHLLYYTDYLPRNNLTQSWIFNAFYLGHYAVAIFIVISGYCLMLPVLRADGQSNAKFWPYIRRRTWRILPPYYGALAICAFFEALKYLSKSPGSQALSRPVDWITHVALIHELLPSTTYTINGPFWSIATEWHIYFVFPLVLLPLYRRYGAFCTVALGLILGISIWRVFPCSTYGCPWFIGLFACGMAAAKFSFSGNKVDPDTLRLLKWSVVIILACTYVLLQLFPDLAFKTYPLQNDNFLFPVFDFLFGIATAIYLVYGARTMRAGGKISFSLQFFSSKPLVLLGAFSYSLYLIHMPLLGMINFIGKRLHIAPSAASIWMLVVASPITIGLSYLFYLVVEKPSLRFSQRK